MESGYFQQHKSSQVSRLRDKPHGKVDSRRGLFRALRTELLSRNATPTPVPDLPANPTHRRSVSEGSQVSSSIPTNILIALAFRQAEFKEYLKRVPDFPDLSSSQSGVESKLAVLDGEQLLELSVDINDEIDRRVARADQGNGPHALEYDTALEHKRNRIRQQLAQIPTERFCQMVRDTADEIQRRLKSPPPDYEQASAQAWAQRVSKIECPPLEYLSIKEGKPSEDQQSRETAPIPGSSHTSSRDSQLPQGKGAEPSETVVQGHETLPTNHKRLSLQSYHTARTNRSSTATYFTARSSTASVFSFYAARAEYGQLPMQSKSEWHQYLKSRNLVPDPFHEMNWSGRGQHAEYKPNELIDIPLKLERAIGFGRSGLVESVRCQRIRLARKTIRCRTRMTQKAAIAEVEHLDNLRHNHIIRLIGTYVIGKDLCILLYPVTEYNLEEFTGTIDDDQDLQIVPGMCTSLDTTEMHAKRRCLSFFFGCLAAAVDFMHEKAVKHMDIKPKNLLVRVMRRNTINYTLEYKIYIADFGIARAYTSPLAAETDSPTSFTKMYAAPEVADRGTKGLSADIFSLGCVFVEMLAILADEPGDEPMRNRQHLEDIRTGEPGNDGERSCYFDIAGAVQAWLGSLTFEISEHATICRKTIEMLHSSPEKRPKAREVSVNTGAFRCNHTGVEPFEAAPALDIVPEGKDAA